MSKKTPLTREASILLILRNTGRLSLPGIKKAFKENYGENVSEGTVRGTLSRMRT